MKKYLWILMIFLIGCGEQEKIEVQKNIKIKNEESKMASLINKKRMEGAYCGSAYLKPTHPLKISSSLTLAARDHSKDMAVNDYFSHYGSKYSNVQTRVKRRGYLGKRMAENIAAGYKSPEKAMEMLMGSVPHCINIMNPKYNYIGVGRAYNSKTYYKYFWTQDFGE